MTQFKPTLVLRRLVVWAKGAVAYDQTFKDGVNIIRGTNSSGKSTILDFIFYILGGEFSKWKHEASLCEYVFAEVTINTSTITLRRKIEKRPRQPMSIFWGPYDGAQSSAVQGWQVFPFQRGAKGEG